MTQLRAIPVVYPPLGNQSRPTVTYWYQSFLASYPRTSSRTWQEIPQGQSGNFHSLCQPSSEFEILETGSSSSCRSPLTAAFMVNSKPPQSNKTQVNRPQSCVFCKGPHTANQCTTTDHQRRLDIVKPNHLCFNCLGKHKVSTCSSKHRCRKCHHKHHTSLCTEATPPKKQENTETTPEGSFSTVVSQPVTTVSLHLASSQTCLLKTAVATISARGTYVELNILFDEGSQPSFLAKGLADCLQVQPHDTVELSLSTFGTGTGRTGRFNVATINLHSSSGHLIPLTVLIVPTIVAPIHTVDQKSITSLPYLNGLRLAHPISSAEQFSHHPADWSRSVLGHCRGPCDQRQWPNCRGIQTWLPTFRPTGYTHSRKGIH